MIAKLYSNGILNAFEKKIDLSNDSIKAMLVTSSYPPNQITDAFKSAVSGELVDSSYQAGGIALTGVSLSINPSTGVVELNCNPITYPALNGTYRYIVIYVNTPSTDATKPLIGYVDFQSNQVSSGQDEVFNINSAGLMNISV